MAVGDGIMSAISEWPAEDVGLNMSTSLTTAFRSDLKRVPDPNGDRVVITLDGKVSSSSI